MAVLVRKGQKQVKSENYKGYSLGLHFARIFKNSKKQPLVIRNIQNHKLNNNCAISYAKNEINGFFVNVSYEILNISYEIYFSKSSVYIKFSVKPFSNTVYSHVMRLDFASRC